MKHIEFGKEKSDIESTNLEKEKEKKEENDNGAPPEG